MKLSRKVTIKAHSDIALIKYWGKKDEVLRLPENGSISFTLSGLDTVTTVEFRDGLLADDVTIAGEKDKGEVERVSEHLDRVRVLAGFSTYAKVVSENTFPKSTGLSSSGSGFAALTVAATRAAGLSLSDKEMSILARQGSGTACRCVNAGFVEWLDGDTSDTSYSRTIFPADYWDIRDVVVVVDAGKKKISSTEGHTMARTSPFYTARLKNIGKKISEIRRVIKEKDFEQLGLIVESEALEFHSILFTMHPPMVAWYPGTVAVILAVRDLRAQGVPAFFTINTGFNVHVLTLPEYEKRVEKFMTDLPFVKKVLGVKVGDKPEELSEDLF